MNNRKPFILSAIIISLLFFSFIPYKKNDKEEVFSTVTVKKSIRKILLKILIT